MALTINRQNEISNEEFSKLKKQFKKATNSKAIYASTKYVLNDVPKLKEDNSDDNSDDKRDWSWYNNSEVNLRVYENETIPEGYVKGMKSRKKKGDK